MEIGGRVRNEFFEVTAADVAGQEKLSPCTRARVARTTAGEFNERARRALLQEDDPFVRCRQSGRRCTVKDAGVRVYAAATGNRCNCSKRN